MKNFISIIGLLIFNFSSIISQSSETDKEIKPLKTIIENVTLPEKVNRLLQSEYAGWRISPKKITDYSEKSLNVYKVKVQNANRSKTLYFDERGDLLEKSNRSF